MQGLHGVHDVLDVELREITTCTAFESSVHSLQLQGCGCQGGARRSALAGELGAARSRELCAAGWRRGAASKRAARGGGGLR
jgi:hypothetical protein